MPTAARWIGPAALALALLAAGCGPPAPAAADRDVLFQVATIDALLSGLYDGHFAVTDLLARGDLGLGTFDALDGEMVVLGGAAYQVGADGRVRPAPSGSRTPFAAVTFFDADETARLDGAIDLVQLEYLIGQIVPEQNMPLAIRIEGTFAHVKTRSVPRQEKPYRKLLEIAAAQPTFEFASVRGTVVGFRCPAFVKGLNVPGLHLHFLTEDRAGGGHVLELVIEKARLDLDRTPRLFIALPEGADFGRADFSAGAADLERVMR